MLGLGLIIQGVYRGRRILFTYSGLKFEKIMDTEFFGLGDSLVNEVFMPRASALCNSLLDLTIDNLRFLSMPFEIEDNLTSTLTKQEQDSTPRASAEPRDFKAILQEYEENNKVICLSMVNLVFVVESTAHTQIERMSEALHSTIHAILYEEENNKFLGSEAYKILNIRRDNKIQKNLTYAELSEKLSIESTLCHFLKRLYHGVFANSTKIISLNDWLKVTVCKTNSPKEKERRLVLDECSVEGSKGVISILDPKLTALSRKDNIAPSILEETLLKNAQVNKSLRKIMKEWEYKVSLQELCAGAKGLVNKGYGKQILPFRMDSHFISNPNFRLTYSGSLGSLDIIFKQSHNEDLRKIIDKMQTPRSILELSESHQKPNLFETIGKISWLLKKTCILEALPYAFPKVPSKYNLFQLQEKIIKYKDKNRNNCVGAIKKKKELRIRLQSDFYEGIESSGADTHFSYLLEDHLAEIKGNCDKKYEVTIDIIYPFFTGEYSLFDISHMLHIPLKSIKTTLDQFSQLFVIVYLPVS